MLILNQKIEFRKLPVLMTTNTEINPRSQTKDQLLFFREGLDIRSRNFLKIKSNLVF